MTQLFGTTAHGRTFADQLRTALDFASTARGATPTVAPDVPAAAAPAADAATQLAEPVAAMDDDALAATLREAALQPQPEIAAAPVLDDAVHAEASAIADAAPIEIAASAPVEAQVAEVATEVAGDVTGPARTGFRGWSAEDIGRMFGRGGRAAAAAPIEAAAPAATADVAVEAADTVAHSRVAGLRGQLADAIGALRGPAAPAATAEVAEVAAEGAVKAARPGLLEQLRTAGAGLGSLRGPAAEATVGLADDAARAAETVAHSVRPGLVEQLMEAAKVATKVRP